MTQAQRVLIVGAGPVGMVCALALNKAGVAVTVLEQEPEPVRDQRAASLHPTTLEMLDDLGALAGILPKGLISPTYHFRDRASGQLVAEFDLTALRDEFRFPFVLQYEQHKLTRDISTQFANESDFDVRFGRRVASLRQFDDRIELEVEGPAGRERHVGAYIVGADGGRSTVRKSAEIAFEGFTYPERFVKIATTFDFQSRNPSYVYRNYFSDPDEWCNLFKVRGDARDASHGEGLWRAIFPTRADEDDADVLSNAGIQARLQKFFPRDGAYEIAYANVYSVSQRVAASFRQNRVLLIGDAAHVNNPIGGLGMNGGIHDAVNLAAKLPDVVLKGHDAAALDLYSRQRRHAAIKFVQAQTIANKKLMEERDEVARAKKFDELRRTAENRDAARTYMRRAAMAESLREAAAVA